MSSYLSLSSCLVSVRVRARKPGKMLSECSRTPPGSAPGGTLETLPRDRPEAPGRDLEKDPSVQVANNHRAVGDSSRKCRVASIVEHSPISLTLPLSSFGWLRNNSSSLPVRASVISSVQAANRGTGSNQFTMKETRRAHPKLGRRLMRACARRKLGRRIYIIWLY